MALAELLHKRMARVPKKFMEAEREVGPNERIIGTASDEALRLWGLGRMLSRQRAKFAERHAKGHTAKSYDPRECLKADEQATDLKEDSRCFFWLFWIMIREELKCRKKNIGIRRGGKVVTWDNPPNFQEKNEVSAFEKLLITLFGEQEVMASRSPRS